MIKVSNVSKSVSTAEGALIILDEINLSVDKGESLAIVGASGSGKSTLLGILAGLDSPSTGDISLADQVISSMDEEGRAAIRAQHVGFVFQSFQLLPGLNALENVMLPLELHGSGDAQQKAQNYLERVGLKHRLKHYPKQLSGGEQQRVAIARAFANTPSILFADEPTGNLDAVTGSTIIDLLFELNQAHGTTLILVTHEQRLAERCGRQITLEAGQLISDSANDSYSQANSDLLKSESRLSV
jgi:putative ABC transport system ATP-binding protein